jgi:hypothetical protein
MLRRAALFCLSLALASFPSAQAVATNAPPAVEELIQRVIKRSRDASNLKQEYAYFKETVIDEFGSDGRVKSTKKKKYLVSLIAGIPHAKLVEVNGKPLTGKDLELEHQREENLRQLRKPSRRGVERQDMYLTEELASRFIFELKGSSAVNDRPAWLLRFKPKPNLAENTLADRFINRIGGEIWVDQLDDEISCVKVQLQERAALWGGFLGTLDRFTLTLFRIRMPEGVWLNEYSEVGIQARKVWKSMHMQVRESSSGHRKQTKAAAAPTATALEPKPL